MAGEAPGLCRRTIVRMDWSRNENPPSHSPPGRTHDSIRTSPTLGVPTMTQPTASGPDQFDPATFTVVEPRTFEDLKVGDIFRAPSRTLTDAHATAFQAVSADNHPIHYNVEYARRHGHTAPLVHGLQVLAFTAPGATL